MYSTHGPLTHNFRDHLLRNTALNEGLKYLFPPNKTTFIEVVWLRWCETDISELRPLLAYCSSPGDCDVDHGMMGSTGANS
jgi:hypothetical protein